MISVLLYKSKLTQALLTCHKLSLVVRKNMATLISDASNELKGSGLANIHGGKLDTNPMVNYTYYRIFHLLITNAFT